MSKLLHRATTGIQGGEYHLSAEEYAKINSLSKRSLRAYRVKQRARSEEIPKVYGVEWYGWDTLEWTRTDSSANFEDPVPASFNNTDSPGSPFDDIYPWCEMTIEERAGGTMVKIPKFYYKLSYAHDTTGLRIQITDKKLPGFYTSPAHMERGDGRGERDVIYVGRYHCAVDSCKSISGAQPQVDTWLSEYRRKAQSLGPNIWIMDWATWWTIQMLYLVEFANWNYADIIIGYHKTYAGENVLVAGKTDPMFYHTGSILYPEEDQNKIANQYRHMENLCGRISIYLDGCYLSSDGVSIILNPKKFNDRANSIIVGTPPNEFIAQFRITKAAGFPMIISVDNADFRVVSPAGGIEYIFPRYGFSPCIIACKGGTFNDQRNLFNIFETDIDGGSTIGARLIELP